MLNRPGRARTVVHERDVAEEHAGHEVLVPARAQDAGVRLDVEAGLGVGAWRRARGATRHSALSFCGNEPVNYIIRTERGVVQ